MTANDANDPNDAVFLKLGREVIRMLHDIRKLPAGDAAYGRRKFTYPGGEFHLLLVNDAELADFLESEVSKRYDVKTVAPHSQTN